MLRNIFLSGIKIIIAIILCLCINYLFITWSTSDKIYYSTEKIKNYKHVLVLGAGSSPLGETQNKSFSSRMNATVVLYHKNEITQIVCSGIIKPPHYNEPYDMKEFLVKKNVPDTIIIGDDGGIITRLAIRSYVEKFPVDDLVIISQTIHLQRAVFIARHYGLNAVGFSAGDYEERLQNEFFLYEVLARVKCTFELIFKS